MVPETSDFSTEVIFPTKFLVSEVIIKNREKYISEFEDSDDQGQIHMVINLLYSYYSNKTKKAIQYTPNNIQIDKKIFDAYEYEFLDLIQFCDVDHLTRLAQVTSLSFVNLEEHLLTRIEKKLIDEKENLDAYQLSQIIKSFGKGKYNAGFGHDKTYSDLEPFVIKNIEEFDMKSLSNVIETYGNREQGSPHLHEKFIKRIKENKEQLDHYTIANLLYYLMYTDNTDEEIWVQMIEQTLSNKRKLPVPAYTAFKMSRYYIQHHFPHLDIQDFYDNFFHPERFYNTDSQENHYEVMGNYKNFTRYLTSKFYLFPVHFVPFHNLFVLRACFPAQKIAIQFIDQDELLPQEKRLTARKKLTGKLMAYEDWEVLTLSQLDHDNMQTQERDEFYTEWFTQAKAKPKERGIMT